MELMEAIYGRRAVRAFNDREVSPELVKTLLQATVQAPSGMDLQPWAFGVLQDRGLIRQYAQRAKQCFLETIEPGSPAAQFHDMLADPSFDMFYQAPLLIVVCAISAEQMAEHDCYFAVENLPLAAHGLGLASCPIGLAGPWLSRPDVKQELGIPANYSPVLAIVVGYSRQDPAPVSRREPEIIAIGPRPT